MRKLVLFTALLAAPAFADGGISVKLPDPAQLAAAVSTDFLMELVQANVVGMNCAGYSLSQGEWTLITQTADQVADALRIGTGAYDERFYGPAFASLDKPGTCEADGPKIAPLIKRLKAMGGGTDPVG
ncbi:MAG: hypothetical protein HC844_13150 [Tabrizicola sp.]|nr:hypothetical protein [Tabrizicola sp.]